MSHYFLCSQNKHSKNHRFFQCMVSDFVAAEFPKTPSPKPARIPPQTPPAGGKSVEAKRKILSPRKNDFRFAESVLKPHALLRNFLGRTPKEKHPFLFSEKIHPRQIRNARSVFSFGVAGVLASAWASFVQFPLEKSSRKVYNYSTAKRKIVAYILRVLY